MAPTDPLTTRPLAPADAEAGWRLSREAGWNQSVDDWRTMLTLAPAIGQTDPAGRLVASALVMPYARRIGWIAMVLTTADHRRRGLATRNLRWAIELCAERRLIAGLDATPEGREVYRPLGFRDLWRLRRWRAEAPAAPADSALRNHDVRTVEAADLADLARLDAATFGSTRHAVLGYLRDNRPDQAWLASRDERIAGFVLARAGRTACHLGPLVAEDDEVARALLHRALRGVTGAVSIDVPDRQAELRAGLTRLGFAPVRPFMRMIRGDGAPACLPARCFAIAGPEFG